MKRLLPKIDKDFLEGAFEGALLGSLIVRFLVAVFAMAAVTSTVQSGPSYDCRGWIPDVSSYQGHPNWSAAKGCGISGGIVKEGEYRQDPDFAYNWAQLKRLHVWHAPYWFVRNTGCAHEGSQIVSILRTNGGLDSGPVVLDMEVPAAYGYANCLDRAVYGAFHRHVVIYTGPGTWPGGGRPNVPLWQAEYGSRLHPFWTPVVAWQCTDGVYGCVKYVPGIGKGDVSRDYGITKLVPAKPLTPAQKKAIAAAQQKKAEESRRIEAAKQKKIAQQRKAIHASQVAYNKKGCGILEGRIIFFRGALHRHPHKMVKKRRHALQVSRKLYVKKGCPILAQRINYFQHAIRAEVKAHA